jgi:DNA-binding Lrp family transcriptional regulator
LTKTSYFSRAYLLDLKQNSHELNFITEPQEVPLGGLDLGILKLMAPNSRIQVIDLAHQLKVTPKTIIKRIKDLEKKRIILGYKTVFDMEKLGYQYHKIFLRLQNLRINDRENFEIFVRKHPNIIYNDEALGGDDFEIELQVKDSAQLRKIIMEIKEKFAPIIKDMKVMEFYKEHKYLFLPVKF